jgi:hypothetical protein
MDGGLQCSGAMNRLLSIVKMAEIAAFVGAAIAIAVPRVQQLRLERVARWDLHVLSGIGYINWAMDHGPQCPPDAAAIARHAGCGRPVDPWGTAYQVYCRERAPFFEVFSAGPDRVAGTRDDVYLD